MDEHTEANAALDRYKRTLHAVFDEVIKHQRFEAAYVIGGVFDVPYGPDPPIEALKGLFERQEGLIRVKIELDAARAALPSVETLSADTRCRMAPLLKDDRDAGRLLEASFAKQAIYAGTASRFALASDSSGAKADKLLAGLLRLKPRRTKPCDPLEEDRRTGLFAASGEMLARFEGYAGKPISYYQKAVRNESRRDALGQLKTERDRLGLVDVPVEQRGELNRQAMDAEVASLAETETADQRLIESEIDAQRAADIERLRASLPENQLALLELILAGLSWTDARAKTGASQSTENALRNRIHRFARDLARKAG